MLLYELDENWLPDGENINASFNTQYVGTRMGVNYMAHRSLWVFEKVAGGGDIVDLLPVPYNTYQVDFENGEDLPKLGFTRVYSPYLTPQELFDEYTNFTTVYQQNVDEGYLSGFA